MRTSHALTVVSLLALASLTTNAQTFQKGHPLTEKYRDAGTHPAGGRSGLASIETRALLGKDGATELQVTTGTIEPPSAPLGTLAKVQIKLLSPSGESLQTDNYRKTLGTSGSAFFFYDNLHRGQLIQTQANVTGIDPTRTDVVTVSTTLVLRPDVKANALQAPSEAHVNTPVIITGVVSEANGDVGAHATCRLLVDGAEIGSVAGIWIDAGSTVSCQFQTAFTSTGTKALKLVVNDAAPSDYDGTNNEATASIDVRDDMTFRYMQAWAWDWDGHDRYSDHRSLTRSDGSNGGTYDYEWGWTQHYQSRGAYAWTEGASSTTEGTVTLEESGDGTVGGSSSANVADLPYGWSWGDGACRWGITTAGFIAQVCSSWYGTEVWGYYNPGTATYTDHYAATGDYGEWYWNGDSTSENPGTLQNLGTLYTATLTHTTAAASHTGSATVVLSEQYSHAYDDHYCWTSTWGTAVENGCWSRSYGWNQFGGWAEQWQ